MIHEAFPARRPFQKVVRASLDEGAGEDRSDPGAVHRHPKRHPGVSWVRVEACGVGSGVCWHFASVAAGWRLRFSCAKTDFRQLQIQWTFSMCRVRRVSFGKNGIGHCTFPLSYPGQVNFSPQLIFRSRRKCSPVRVFFLLHTKAHRHINCG